MSHRPEVRFCYRCGNRVKESHSSCWYCGADTHREIRRPQECPFCGESISHKAIKCKHCGEFLDGRNQKTQDQTAPHITFQIDKAVFGQELGFQLPQQQGEQAYLVQGGGRVPEDVARALPESTVKAIEENNPRLLDHPGVKALPGPEGEILEGESTERDHALTRQETQAPAMVEKPSAGKMAGQLVRRTGGLVARAAAKTAQKVQEKREARKEAAEEVVDVEAEESRTVVVNCPVCKTEIFSGDNYCFHCGAEFQAKKGRRKPAFSIREKPNGGHYGLVFLLGLALGFMGLGSGRIETVPVLGAMAIPLAFVLAGLMVLLLLLCLFRRPRLSTLFWALGLGGYGGLTLLLALWGLGYFG